MSQGLHARTGSLRRFSSVVVVDGRPEPEKVLLSDICFGEGPRWRDGALFFSDFYANASLSADGKDIVGGGEIRRVDLSGSSYTVAAVPGQPSGLGFGPSGCMYVVSMKDRRLCAVPPPLVDEASGEELALELATVAELGGLTNGPCNDMVMDEQSGLCWIGNFGWDLFGGAEPAPTKLCVVDTEAWRLRATGEQGSDDGGAGAVPGSNAIARPTGGDVLFPNGAVLTDQGKTLVVAETIGKQLTAFDICAAGSGELTNGRVWAELPHRPDGIALDREGCIWVACPTFHKGDTMGQGIDGGYIRVQQGGEILSRIELAGRGGFACTFGGDDGSIFFGLDAAEVDPFNPVTLKRGNARITMRMADVPGAGFG